MEGRNSSEKQESKAKVFIKTYGCTANQADSVFMSQKLLDSGFEIVRSLKDSDLVIVNSCTVKQIAENKFWKSVRDAKKLGKKVIAAGCVPKAEESLLDRLKDCSIVSPRDIDKISDIAQSEIEGKHLSFLDGKEKKLYSINLPLRNQIVGIVPISEGCLGNCSYCKTRFARGELYSYDEKDIIRQINHYITLGAKELWITSQDTGCYGLDINTTIVNLLKEISKIKGDYFIRLGMMNVNYAYRFRKEFAEIINNSDNFFRFLHIPIQSANNRVLGLMRRQYGSEMIYKTFNYLKDNIKDLTLSTDIICGFPSESEEEFADSLKFIEDIKPGVLNISRFWPRPGTDAAKMKQFYNQVMIKRAAKLRELFNNIAEQENRKWIDWHGEAIYDEIGKEKSMILRNRSYKQIIIKEKDRHKKDLKLGDKIKVKINNVTSYDLRAKIYD